MFKILTFTLLAVFTLNADVNWQTDYLESVKLSQETKKPIFAYIRKNVNAQSPHYKYTEMAELAFKHEKIAKHLNQYFIPLEIIDTRAFYGPELLLRREGIIVDRLSNVPETLLNRFFQSPVRLFCLIEDESIVAEIATADYYSRPEILFEVLNEMLKRANPKKGILRYGN